MKLSLKAGTISKSVLVFVQDSSQSMGIGLAGLVYNTSNLVAYYCQPGVTGATAITLATLASTTAAYSSGGFKEIDATNMKGVYRLDIPNAALTGATSVVVMLSGAADMVPVVLEIELTAWNNQDTVRGGLTALPNTACTTNASLLTSGAGTDQISVASGRVDIGKILGTASAGQAGYMGVDWAQVANKTTTNALTGTTIATTQQVDVNTIKTQTITCSAGVTVGAFVGNATASLEVDASGRVDIGKILGTASAGQAGYVGLDWGVMVNKTTSNALTGTTISTSQVVASVTGAVGSVTGAVGSVTGAVGSVTGNVGGNVVGTVASVVGNVGGNVVGSTASIANAPANFSSLNIDASGNVYTKTQIKKNTAVPIFEFKMRLSSDHYSPATGKTVSCQRSIDGGSFSNCNTVTATEVSNGFYYVPLAASDVNGNVIVFRATATSSDPTEITIYTQP